MKKVVKNKGFIFNPNRKDKIMPIQTEGYNWTLSHLVCTEHPAELIKTLEPAQVSLSDKMDIEKMVFEFFQVHLNLTKKEREETAFYRDPVGNFRRFIVSTSLWEYENEYHITLAMYLDDLWCRDMHKPFRSLVIAKKPKTSTFSELYNYANAVGKLANTKTIHLVRWSRFSEYRMYLEQVTPDDALYFEPSKHNPYPILELYGTYVGFMRLDV